jgi:hypothetical protein
VVSLQTDPSLGALFTVEYNDGDQGTVPLDIVSLPPSHAIAFFSAFKKTSRFDKFQI